MNPSSAPIVLSRDTVLDSVAHAFAQRALSDVSYYVLPFGELRWTGWKSSQANVGITGQLVLWVYDMDVPREDRVQRSYVVSLPDGGPQRYEPGDALFIEATLSGEQLSLALHDGPALEARLRADFIRAIHAIVDFVISDWPEMVALLMWRGIQAGSVDARRAELRAAL